MSDEPQPIGRFQWERLVARADLPKHVKALAFGVAIHAAKDGSRVRPGRKLLADIFDDSERTVEIGLADLVERGLLKLVKKGGGTNQGGTVNLYQLTDPGPGKLPMRLDPDGNRLTERVKKRRPGKLTDPKPTSGESPVDNPDSDDPDSGLNRSGLRVGEATDPKWVADRPEVGCTPNRSAVRPITVEHTEIITPRVLPLGDPLTSAEPGDVEKPNGVTGDGVEPEPAAVPVGDLDYARAQKILRPLSPLERDLLLSAARERLTTAGTPLKVRSLTITAAAIHEIKESA